MRRRALLRHAAGLGGASIALPGCLDRGPSPTGPDGPLAYTPGYFVVYESAAGGDPGDPAAFGYPDAPAFGGYNDNRFAPGDPCIVNQFDTRRVIRRRGGEELHTTLRFTRPGALVGDPKPYILAHAGDGRYAAVTTIDFDPPNNIPGRYPWAVLNAHDTWRAVVTDYVVLDAVGGQFDWAVTRADFYALDDGVATFDFSFQYLFWADDASRGNDVGPDPPTCEPWQALPAVVALAASRMMAAGPSVPGSLPNPAAIEAPPGRGPPEEPPGRGPGEDPPGRGPSDEPPGRGPGEEPPGRGPSDEPPGRGPGEDPPGRGPSDDPSDAGDDGATPDDAAGGSLDDGGRPGGPADGGRGGASGGGNRSGGGDGGSGGAGGGRGGAGGGRGAGPSGGGSGGSGGDRGGGPGDEEGGGSAAGDEGPSPPDGGGRSSDGGNTTDDGGDAPGGGGGTSGGT